MDYPSTLVERYFLADTAGHQLRILLEMDSYLHLRMANPTDNNAWFEVLCAPNLLVYNGDMGSFTWTRRGNPFDLFAHREPSAQAKAAGATLYENFDYWAEKLAAVDSTGGDCSLYCFDHQLFSAHVRALRLDWIRQAHADQSLSRQERRSLWEAIQDELLDSVSDLESIDDALVALQAFSWTSNNGDHYAAISDDLDPRQFSRFSHAFQWACYAVSMAHRLYSQARAVPQAT